MNKCSQHVVNTLILEGMDLTDEEIFAVIDTVADWIKRRAQEKDMEQPVDAPYFRLVADEIQR